MDKKGVSAVIGVVLMVVITLAIAVTVFVYVSYKVIEEENKEFVGGNITEKNREWCDTFEHYHYVFVIDDSFDMFVNESVFYDFDVGDWFEW